jgi:hypothetical protein
MLRSWKTTLAGVFTGIGAISQAYLAWYNGHPIPWDTAIPMIVSALGLLLAKDWNATWSN